MISIYILATIETPFYAFFAFLFTRQKTTLQNVMSPVITPWCNTARQKSANEGPSVSERPCGHLFETSEHDENKWRAGGRAGGDPRSWLLRCVVAVRERGQTRVHQNKNRVDVTVRVTHPHSMHAAYCTRRSIQERRKVHEQRTFRTIRRSQSIKSATDKTDVAAHQRHAAARAGAAAGAAVQSAAAAAAALHAALQPAAASSSLMVRVDAASPRMPAVALVRRAEEWVLAPGLAPRIDIR